MINKLFKTLVCTILAILTVSQFSVFAASKPPAWLQSVEGTMPEEEESAELKAWREEKRTLKVPILLYHHITTDQFTDEESVSLISPEDFRLHMEAIKAAFSPISLRDYYEYVMCDNGKVTLPKNPIVITFDDGYLSNYEIAYPILKELNIPATIFIVTDTVGAIAGEGKVNNSHFSWEQAKEMESSGLIEIQSHTVSHLKLTEQTMIESIRQLRKSKYDIEKNLGKRCDMVAYPYGAYNETLKNAARAAGYKMQLLVDNKSTGLEYDVNLPGEGVESITRITVAGTMGNVNVIETIIQTMNSKEIPAE